ncbi:hypothetical protein EC973_005363 [Apophysomyces ossiformis]|uniref:Uncharacterized protein n=1 Tax=Apophysomyces ossiformis TaxID=679940 RepID=A0A8H7ELC9_9FUNG|nr:hypothetical protein EC973_005363 [Apophysomyces ossiformis]
MFKRYYGATMNTTFSDGESTLGQSAPATPPHTTISPNDDDEGLYLLWTHQLLREHGLRPASCRPDDNDDDEEGNGEYDDDDDSSITNLSMDGDQLQHPFIHASSSSSSSSKRKLAIRPNSSAGFFSIFFSCFSC